MNRRTFLGAVVAGAAGITVSGCDNDRPVGGARESDPRTPSTFTARTVGFSTGSSVLWAAPTDVARTMSAVVAAGATTVRVDVSWAFAEPRPGLYEWGPSDRVIDAATRRGLTVLATITNTPAWAAVGRASTGTAAPADPSVYGRFAGAVAARYRGRVGAYEIWNEPNGRLFFGPDPDPDRYTAMVRAAYPAVKAADPTALVVAGALGNTSTGDGLIDSGDFLTAMYAAGGQGFFDALSYHPYDYGMPLGDGTVYARSPMQQMIAMHAQMTARGDGEKKIWVTEYGAPTAAGGVDASVQADLVAGSIQQWPEVHFAGPFYVYTVRDGATGSTDPEANFGAVRTDYTPKPVYSRISALTTAGVPARDAATFFDGDGIRAVGDGVGRPVSPVYFVPSGSARQYEYSTIYYTSRGWFVSPPAVADVARSYKITPTTEFRNGYQDFLDENGIRVFSDMRFGTYVVRGAILGVWTPELGFPLGDEFAGGDGDRTQEFENGTATWNSLSAPSVTFRG